jgi:hypothetical protein
LPDATWVEEVIPAGSHFARAFKLTLPQPVDHANPSGQKFNQTIYLSYVADSVPTVLETRGYAIYRNHVQELSTMLGANQIYVGHRYLAEGLPEPTNWTYLTAAQIAGDYHRIKTLLGPTFTGPWVSCGASKGGITALMYRRHFPDDVAATVSYVAPVMFDTADARFDNYILNQAGDSACRAAIVSFQRAALLRRTSLLPLIEHHAYSQGYTYRLGIEATFEIGLLEYPFFFWQFSYGDCSEIPDSTATTTELWNYYQMMANIDWLNDEAMDYFAPVFYQQYTELGYYRLITEPVADLLEIEPHPSYSQFCPEGVARVWKPDVMQDLNSWLQTEGDNIVHLYGGRDPYTAAAIELTGQCNALRVIEPGEDHNVKIADLSTRQAEVLDSLETWTGVTPQLPSSDLSGTRSREPVRRGQLWE